MDGLLLAYVLLLWASNASCLSKNSFPADFSFGAGTSAYQIEGATSDDDKSDNIWDYAIKNDKSIIIDGSNASIADKSYYDFYGFEPDVDALLKMNCSHYRMSISWSRVCPDGICKDDSVSLEGMGHYEKQIDHLLEHNITPIVTLYHWDLPQIVQEWGGWTNSSNIDVFLNYAEQVFHYLLAVDVKYFITFNEPKQICKSGYGDGTLAPFETGSGTDDYLCAYNVLKAHAALYNLIKTNYSDFDTKISIAIDGSWSEPQTDSSDDKEAAERRNQFEFGLYANPVINGDWPQSVIDRVQERSKDEGLEQSRLPAFTDDEKEALKGTMDFLALNYYDTRLVANDKEADKTETSYANDIRVVLSTDPSWKIDAADKAIFPQGLRRFLRYVKSNYGDYDILITGNGYADDTGTAHDGDRVDYLSEYLSNVVDAIVEDKVNVVGYTYWSLVDSFEWTLGYKPHYGLYGVDLDFDNYTRIAKRSSHYYALVIKEFKVANPSELVTTTTSTTTTEAPTSTTTNTITTTDTVTTTDTITSTTTESDITTPESGGSALFNHEKLLQIVLIFLGLHYFLNQ